MNWSNKNQDCRLFAISEIDLKTLKSLFLLVFFRFRKFWGRTPRKSRRALRHLIATLIKRELRTIPKSVLKSFRLYDRQGYDLRELVHFEARLKFVQLPHRTFHLPYIHSFTFILHSLVAYCVRKKLLKQIHNISFSKEKARGTYIILSACYLHNIALREKYFLFMIIIKD